MLPLLAPLTVAVFSVLSAFCGLISDSVLWEAFQRGRAWFWTCTPVAGESKSTVLAALSVTGVGVPILHNQKEVISTPTPLHPFRFHYKELGIPNRPQLQRSFAFHCAIFLIEV